MLGVEQVSQAAGVGVATAPGNGTSPPLAVGNEAVANREIASREIAASLFMK